MLGSRKLDKEEVEKLKNLIKRQSISEEKPDKIKLYLQELMLRSIFNVLTELVERL